MAHEVVRVEHQVGWNNKDETCDPDNMKSHADPLPTTLGLPEHEKKYSFILINMIILYIFVIETIPNPKIHTLDFCLKGFLIFYYSIPKQTSDNWQLELLKLQSNHVYYYGYFCLLSTR